MTVVVRIGYGLGGRMTSGGIDRLVQTIAETYPLVDVDAHSSGEMESIIGELNHLQPTDKIVVGGYSWGADNAPIICSRVPRPIEYCFQLQPSFYYPSTPITSNVKKALCVYNPWFWETGGLGFKRGYKAEGNTVTDMQVIMAHDAHPAVDDNPVYHAMIVRAIGAIFKPKGTANA